MNHLQVGGWKLGGSSLWVHLHTQLKEVLGYLQVSLGEGIWESGDSHCIGNVGKGVLQPKATASLLSAFSRASSFAASMKNHGRCRTGFTESIFSQRTQAWSMQRECRFESLFKGFKTCLTLNLRSSKESDENMGKTMSHEKAGEVKGRGVEEGKESLELDTRIRDLLFLKTHNRVINRHAM